MILRGLCGLLLLVLALPGLTARYYGESQDAAAVRSLLERLERHGARLERLLRLHEDIAREQRALDERKGEFSERFTSSDSEHPDVVAFRERVAAHNERISRHNALARELEAYFDQPGIARVQARLAEVKRLRGLLRETLDEGNYVKADYIARQSELARELGYAGR